MMSDWRPIATAPRDRTSILVVYGDEQAVAFWWQPDPQAPKGFVAGWHDGVFHELEFEPTHWQPLPPSPATHDG